MTSDSAKQIGQAGFQAFCNLFNVDSKYVFDCGQFDLVVGRLPSEFILFRPARTGFSIRERERYLRVLRNRKEIFESDGWVLEEDDEPEIQLWEHEVAKHKYMQIEIFNRER